MQKLANPVKVTEVEGEGLVGLLGKRIVVYCLNYIYTGDLEGVNKDDIKLTSAKIVYDTGKLDAAKWADVELLPYDSYIRLSSIEHYGEVNHD